MKKIVLNVALVAFIGIGAISCKNKENSAEVNEAQEVAETSAATTYTLDTDASVIDWKGSKPTGTHNGTVQLAEGSVEVKDNSVAAGSFVIDMTSITDLDLEGDMRENLEAHLKGTVEGKEGDFFNVTKYPTASFEITSINETEGKTMVSGNLTMKEKTHNVTFPATISMNGNTMELKSETFSIDRTLWDVNFGSKSVFDNLGDKFISDEIELTISVVASTASNA